MNPYGSGIVVTGGTGMVGKHLKDLMPEAVYVSSTDCDLTDSRSTDYLFSSLRPKIVIHLAARVGGIVDNTTRLVDYLDDNVLINTNALKYSHKYGADRFIAVLSTCAYPDTSASYPMTESNLHDGAPTAANFGYAYAKRLMAVQIESYNKQYNTRYNYIIPCNLYSEYDNFGNDTKAHFITALLAKLRKYKGERLYFHGTGNPLRQFMYAADLAKAIKYTVDHDVYSSFNIAYPENLSIDEMISRTIAALNIDVNYSYLNDGLDGQFRKDVSINKLLTIMPDFKFTLFEDGIKHVYNKIV